MVEDTDDPTDRALRRELTMAQIDKGRLDIERVRQEMRFEPWKAAFLGLGAGAALLGAGVGIGNLIWAHRTPPPTPIVIQLPAPATPSVPAPAPAPMAR